MRLALLSAILSLGVIAMPSSYAKETQKQKSKNQVVKVEFTPTPAPKDIDKITSVYTESKIRFVYSNGKVKEYPLQYNVLFSVLDRVGNNPFAAGQALNYKMEPIKDPHGKDVIFETPDANSLLKVGNKIFLVTHYEYDWLLSNGEEGKKSKGWYTRVPSPLTLTELKQDRKTGKLFAVNQKHIDTSKAKGVWITCFGSQTPWNTHLGGEEDYDLLHNPLSPNYEKKTIAGLKAITDLYFKGEKQANPYHYGRIFEVFVKKDGSYTIKKHYAMGRGTFEHAIVMPDGKTAYFGDDGTYTMLLMFVADKSGNLSSGTLYAAKWIQESAENGGRARLEWIKLGHANNDEVLRLIESGISFDDIWDNAPFDKNTKSCPVGYKHIRAGSSFDECLKLKPGMEKAAAFLETRRYAAYLGATTEFEKMEGISFNAKDKKLYIAMSYIENGMLDQKDEPANHIALPKLKAGAVYTLDLGKDKVIGSGWVAKNMYVESPLLLGKDLPNPDEKGNTADEDHIANPDNLFFSERLRTLFIGEDSSKGHVNNYLWAYNVDTKELVRILSLPAGAEATGLQVVEDLNGYTYILANSQHWGDIPQTVPDRLKEDILKSINRFYAPIGYIGPIPKF